MKQLHYIEGMSPSNDYEASLAGKYMLKKLLHMFQYLAHCMTMQLLNNLESLESICNELNLSHDVSLSADVTQCSFTEIRHELKNQTTQVFYVSSAEI